jgi:rhodanese-related sulfurtransferase/predicted double-glycine peptidase
MMANQWKMKALVTLIVILDFGCGGSSAQLRVDSGSACGMYCLYSITQIFGMHTDIRSLVTPMYVTAHAGSTIADLKHAATDQGLYAVALGNMTEETLRSSPYAMILHVRKSLDSKLYDHWIVFLGARQDLLNIYDPPNAPQQISFNQLASLWDGNGLIVAQSPIDVGKLEAAAIGGFVEWAVAVTAVLLVMQIVRKGQMDVLSLRRWMHRSMVESGTILIAAACMGVCYQIYAGDELLTSASATSIAEAYDTTFMQRLTISEVKKLIGNGTNVVVIDARYSRDYQVGHIPGAISIPVNSTVPEIEEKARGVRRQSSVIVYCQSAECGFAEIIASRLRKEGIGSIMLFPGGWLEWAKADTDQRRPL